MNWEFWVAIVIAIPVILFPVCFVWFINVSGLYAVVKDSKRRQKARECIK